MESVDFILDMETLGKRDNSVILSIGILPCPADMGKDVSINELVKTGLYLKLNREEQIRLGRVVDQETVLWWKKQSDEAREVLNNNDLTDILEAYTIIKSFILHNGFIKNQSIIWSRGMIDARWWQSFCETCHTLDPNVYDFFFYWNWRDTRTALDIFTGSPNGYYKTNTELVKHNALYDCCIDYLRFQNAYKGNK